VSSAVQRSNESTVCADGRTRFIALQSGEIDVLGRKRGAAPGDITAVAEVVLAISGLMQSASVFATASQS
jgi:hypothetical protein